MADASQVSAHITGDWGGNFHIDYVDFTNDTPFDGTLSYTEFQDGHGTFAQLTSPISLAAHSTRRVYLYMFPQRRDRVFTVNYVHERYFSECGNYIPGGGGLSTPAFQVRDL